MKHPSDPSNGIGEGIDFIHCVIEGKGCPRRGRDPKVSHHWLRTVMSGSDCDAPVVQYGPDVVRVYPFQSKPDWAGLLGRSTNNAESFHAR